MLNLGAGLISVLELSLNRVKFRIWFDLQRADLSSMIHCGYTVGTLWVHCGYIVGTVRKGAIISFTYCSFNTFKFKGSNMFDKPNRVVVGDGGGPNIASLFLVLIDSPEFECPPEGGKVGAF